jgi:hypothetical protein
MSGMRIFRNIEESHDQVDRFRSWMMQHCSRRGVQRRCTHARCDGRFPVAGTLIFHREATSTTHDAKLLVQTWMTLVVMLDSSHKGKLLHL